MLRVARIGAVVGSAVALTAAAFWPIVAHPNSTVVGEPGDMSSSARDYWAAEAQGKTPFTLVEDSLFRAPDGRKVSPAVQVANAVQPGFVLAVKPVGGYLGAFNIFMLVGIVASLVATYWLLTWNGIHRAAAAVAAIAFASSPWTIEQLLYGHSAFAHVWVYPVLLASLCWSSRESRTRAIVPGLALALAFYVSSYLGLFSSLIAVVFLLALLLGRARDAADVAARLGVAVASTAVALLPAALATRITPSAELGLPEWGKENLVGAEFRDFFLPSSHHPLFGSAARQAAGEHVGESVAFYGYASLLLALAATVMLTRSRGWSLLARVAVILVPVGWLMALPAHVSIAGRDVPLPNAANLVGEFVPWWRIYARFASVAGFGLVILAAIALDRLLRSCGRGRLALAIGAAAVMVVEAAPGTPIDTHRLRADAVTEWLQQHPGGIVASYPIVPGPERVDAWDSTYWSFYYFQIRHRHPIFDPPRGLPDPTPMQIASLLAFDVSEPRTIEILSAAGVRWVVVRDELYRITGQPRPRIGRGLALVARVPGARIFRVVASPADLRQVILDALPDFARELASGYPSVTFGTGFHAPEQFRAYMEARWMAQGGRVTVRPSGAGRYYIVYRLALRGFSANGARRLEIVDGDRTLQTFTVPQSEVLLQTDLGIPDETTFTFRAAPGPISFGPNDPRSGSIFFQSLTVEPVGVTFRDGTSVSAPLPQSTP